MTIVKPQQGQFKPFSGAYISLVPDNIEVSALQSQLEEMKAFLSSIPAEKWNFRYAEGKWTLKEMLLHMIDTERIFSYRALRIGRNDTTPLPGFNQDVFVPASNANTYSVADLLSEWEAVRKSTYLLFSHFDKEAFSRTALVDNHPVSVSALLYLVMGHPEHHRNIIKERYL